MSDFLKLALEADAGVDCSREITAVQLTLRLSRTVQVDGESRAVTVSYRREVVQIVEGPGDNTTIINDFQTANEDQTCVHL